MRTEPFESRRIWICTLALLCTAFGSACQRSRAAGPAPGAASAPAAERLITIGGPITETVFALGRGDAVVAVDTSSVFPAEVAQLPKVGYQRTLAAEGVLALRPTRIIATEEAGPPAALVQLRRAGIVVELIPSEPSLAGARNKIAFISRLLAVPERGTQLIARLDAEAAAATAPAAAIPLRVLFMYARGTGTMQVAGSGTNADAMIRLSGAENAARMLAGYKPLSAEFLLAARPDVILLTSRGMQSLGGAQAALQLPGLSALPAERRPHLLMQDDLLLLGFGPRTGQAIGELRARLAAVATGPTATAAADPVRQ